MLGEANGVTPEPGAVKLHTAISTQVLKANLLTSFVTAPPRLFGKFAANQI